MKKIMVTLFTILFLTGVIFTLSAEEGVLTEEEALAKIEEYKQMEQVAQQKIDEEQAKVDALKSDIAALDEEIASLEQEVARLEAKYEKMRWYVVKPGDWLSKLAEYPEVYGPGNYKRWKDIYNANKRLIRDPDLIYPDWKLEIPRP